MALPLGNYVRPIAHGFRLITSRAGACASNLNIGNFPIMTDAEGGTMAYHTFTIQCQKDHEHVGPHYASSFYFAATGASAELLERCCDMPFSITWENP